MSTPQFLRKSDVMYVLWSSDVATAISGELSADEVLRPSTVIFAEIPQPQNLLSAVYDHKFVAHLEALDQVRAAMEKKQSRLTLIR